MKKRTWQKAAALIACAAMIITTPDISNLVNVSGSSYEDETTGVEFISNEAEDVEAVSEDEDGFSGTEISDENQTTDTDFSASDADTDTAEFVSDFSSGTDEGTDSAMITDTETEVQPAAAVILESADAPQASAAAQGQPRWVHITSNASSTRQGKARIRLYMTDAQDDSPAYILYTSLFSQWQETVPEQEPSSGAVTLPPTELEGALNGTDVLSVSRVQEYQKDDNGEYVLDANGNLITTACYLEYELAAGSSADFYAAFVYKTQDESYSYKADLKAKVTWEEEEQSQDVTLPEDTGKITLAWDSSAVTSGDTTISADPEVPDNQEDETSGEGSQEQPSLVRISMTKTLEAGCQDVADDASDTEAEDVSDENTDSADENTENTSAESEIALSGQLYGVHVTAQDLHTDATADSTIKLDLKDMGSGLPVSGLFVSMGKTEEEALSSEVCDSSVIPNGLTDGDLTVTRVQNDSEDYLTFQLPAGDTADFYVGISYHAQEETYHKTIGIEPEALQETSLQDVDAQQETDSQNIEEQQSATNAELDVLSALPGAIPVESETAAVQDETSQDPESQDGTDGDAGEDAGKQLISVLESGAAAITLAWADNTTPSTGMVYFAAPADWISNGWYTVKAWTQANQNDSQGTLTVMTDTKASYDGMKVYALEVTGAIKPYAGLYTMLFQAFEADNWKNERIPFREKWTDESVFLNKLYNSSTEQWVDYTPFDPNDHTSFKGKTMYFENKTEQILSGVNAVFYEKDSSGKLQQVQSVAMTGNANGKANGYSVIIPDAACSYVQFTDASGNVLGDTYSNFYGQGIGEDGVESVLYAEGSTDCYKYAGTAENSTWGVLGSRTVYFDATYSKLSYKGSAGAAYSIPAEDGTFKYYISGDGKEAITGNMTLVSSHSEKGHTWKDVYKAELPEGYTTIAFFGFTPKNATDFGEHGESTNTLTIPTDLENPCFYADAGDTVVYDGGQRDGYWDEVYTIRNAEAKKSKDVVDIAQDNFTRASDTLYVNSTFYDYYTDYELNGNNRDEYPGGNGVSYRNWVTHREFDQALSDYYWANTSSIPLYVGHFQPSISGWGYQFNGIASTLNLYGYDNYNNFFSTNNSALDINGNNNGDYKSIAKGLVKDTLADGNLVATKEGAILPLFNEAFLMGNNSKNAVIGDVYHNVAFPFKQKDLKGDGVNYWVFDSNETTLLMRQDSATGEYHLQDTGKLHENCKNLNSSSVQQEKHGFFPFNETSLPGSANTYNYGFGAKLEFNFRLTKDGTVKDKNGKDVPIEFNFSGDDDVWVFIDGKLALDVGGAHSPATGKLDFSTLTATVSDVKASAGDETPTTVTNFTLEGDKTAEHTLTMFYMERGMWESNMKVTFNFPDENQLQVEKQVDTTDVNSLFSNLFKDSSIFNFSIKNLATHYGERKVTSDAAKPLRIAEQDYTVAPTHKDNIFAKDESGNSNFTGSVHWHAKEDDADSSYRDQRYGELTLGEPIDISKMAYLEIKFYYDYNDTPSLSNMYLQFEDSSGNLGGNLGTETLSGRTYGSVSIKSREWVTVKLDLSKMSWSEGFDKTNLKKLRFGYNFPRDFYLKDFVFRPTVEISEPTGFVTKQYKIPDYGSATSGKLEIPEGATYTSTSTKRDARVIGDDGEFVLEDHETVTFKDQFRRGSYIALKEEVDPDLFDTTWTMYENGQAVAGMGSGTTITNASPIPGMTNQTGTAIDDGRTEAMLTELDADGQKQENAYTGTKPTESTFVFRSYADPDNTTTATKLKAVFYNKVKTGTLKITKTAAYGEKLSGEYKFRVTFTNVGDLGLEENPITQDCIIKLNGDGQPGSCEITGIPVGTFFKVEEISTDDGSTLDSILIDKTEQPKGTTAAKGDIKSSGTTVETTFRNTKKPVVNISVEKLWKNADESDYKGKLPEKIYVQLQRRQSDTDTWAPVSTDENAKTYTELAGNMYTGKWQTSFTGLDKCVDYTQKSPIEWQYRVVEVSVGQDGTVTPIKNENTIQFSEGRFAVTYNFVLQDHETVTFKEDRINFTDENAGEEIITNTYQLPKTRIQILKIQAGTAGDNPTKLAGAKFRLEKLLENGSVDSSFRAREETTSDQSDTLGLAAFEDLEDGTYQITEIQAPEEYSLLASPIKVVLNRKDNSILVDKQDVSHMLRDDTITIQVADQKKFNLPATGSWSRLILGFSGGILIGLAVIIYLLQKRRKEGKAS